MEVSRQTWIFWLEYEKGHCSFKERDTYNAVKMFPSKKIVLRCLKDKLSDDRDDFFTWGAEAKLLLTYWWPFDYKTHICLLLLPWRETIFQYCQMQSTLIWLIYKYNCIFELWQFWPLYTITLGDLRTATLFKCLTLSVFQNSCTPTISLFIVWQYLFQKPLKMTFLCVYVRNSVSECLYLLFHSYDSFLYFKIPSSTILHNFTFFQKESVIIP